jgi:hypothetical protein
MQSVQSELGFTVSEPFQNDFGDIRASGALGREDFRDGFDCER